jgi:hypothetical protein
MIWWHSLALSSLEPRLSKEAAMWSIICAISTLEMLIVSIASAVALLHWPSGRKRVSQCEHTVPKTDNSSYLCPIAVVMADASCWRRTAAPPLSGYRMVGRVLMKYLPQFEGRRWRSCWAMATEVGSDRHGECMVKRGAEITSRPKFGGREFGKGSIK